MSFFLPTQKSKRQGKTTKIGKRKKPRTDEEFDSGSEIHSDNDAASVESDEEIEETAQEKRLRMAKEYLAKLEAEEGSKDLERAIDRDAIAHRLKDEELEQAGRLQKCIAGQFLPPRKEMIQILKGHKLSVTCTALSHDEKYVFSGSKDGSVIKWHVETGRKLGQIHAFRKGKARKGHKGHILCLALSSDGKYLATGGHDLIIHIWNPDTLNWIHTFKGHKKNILGLTFRIGTHQLFSASADRSVKIWNVDEMAYVETLFGHEDAVMAIDSLIRDRALTCGARDKTVRLWKVLEESQLVFKDERTSCIDCVAMINEEHFVSAADDGSLSLWSVRKKRPLTTLPNAHMLTEGTDQSLSSNECWLSSVAAVRNSDFLASAGSCDSCIRLWKCQPNFKGIEPLFSIPVTGFVNSLSFSDSGNLLIAGIGQEHRLGRWWKMKEAKNSIYIIRLVRDEDNDIL